MDFGDVIRELKADPNTRASRQGWNGKGMFIVLMPPLSLAPFRKGDELRRVNDRTARHIGVDTPLECLPYFAMYTADKKWLPGWLASQSDMLAEDWCIEVSEQIL